MTRQELNKRLKAEYPKSYLFTRFIKRVPTPYRIKEHLEGRRTRIVGWGMNWQEAYNNLQEKYR